MLGKDQKEFAYPSKGLYLIAPSEFVFKLRPQALTTYASKHWGEVSIQTLSLHCGNPQKQVLSYQSSDATFVGKCFYDKKGNYTISLEVRYKNTLTNEVRTITIPVGTLDFKSEIQIFKTNSQNPQRSTLLSATQGAVIL